MVTATSGAASGSFAEAVTTPGPARADLSIAVSAPPTVHTGAALKLTVTVTNHGPSAAGKPLTAVAISYGFAITNTGGGTRIGSSVLFVLPHGLAARASQTYTVTLTATRRSRRSGATVRAATVSVTRDPN